MYFFLFAWISFIGISPGWAKTPLWSEFVTLPETKLQELSKQLTLKRLNLGSLISSPTLSRPKITDLPEAELWLGDKTQSEEMRIVYQAPKLLALLNQISNGDPESTRAITQFNLEKWSQSLIHPSLRALLKNGQNRLKREKSLSERALQSFRRIAKTASYQVSTQMENARAQGLFLDKNRRLLVVNVAAELQKDRPGARTIESFNHPTDGALPRIVLYLEDPELPSTREVMAAWVDSSEFDIEPRLDLMNQVIHAALSRNYIVYVQGKLGVSRSATLVLDYLLHFGDYRKVTLEQPYLLFDTVFADVARQRPSILPNYTFARILEFREAEFLKKLGIQLDE